MSSRKAPLLRPRRTSLIVLMVVLTLVGSGALYLFAGLRSPTAGLLGRDWDASRSRVDVLVRPDASISVQEDLHLRVKDGHWGEVYAPISPGRAELDLVSLENVEGESIDDEGYTEGLELVEAVDEVTEPTAGGGVRVRGLTEASGKPEERVVRLTYEAKQAAVAYDDVVVVSWAVRSADWDVPLNRLDATISMEGSGGVRITPIRSWVRPGALGAATVDTPEAATLRVRGLRAGRSVVMTAMFPRSELDSTAGAVVRKGTGQFDVIAREDRAAAASAGGISTWVWTHQPWLAGLVLLLAAVASTALVGQARRRRHGGGRPDPTGRVPESVRPATAFGLATLRGDEDTLVLATLLDLLDRGFYMGTLDAGDLTLAIAPRPSAPAPALTAGERAVLALFDRFVGDRHGALATLHERAPQHDRRTRDEWSFVKKTLQADAEDSLSFEGDLRLWRTRIIAAGTLLLIVVGAVGWQRSSDVALLAAAFPLLVGITVAYPSHLLRPLSVKSHDRHREWTAFALWTQAPPAGRRLDPGPASVSRALTYAMAFGTLGRLATGGQVPASAPAGAWWAGLADHPPAFLADTEYGEGFGGRWSGRFAPESSD